MLKDSISAKGELQIILMDEHGNVKLDTTVPNLVVTVGKNVIASRLTGTSTAVMSHMSVGTSSATPVAANTTLGAEIAGSRTALATSGGIATNNEVNYSCTFPAGTGTGAIVEAGIFNAASAGSMLCQTTFSVVNKGALDSMTINWKVSIG